LIAQNPVRFPVVRCTGGRRLEPEFNSLDAQREACEAFITTQWHTSWIALPETYDVGGLSGGTMERQALQRLLANIKAGKVQIIVVYKVDRLGWIVRLRALCDQPKPVENGRPVLSFGPFNNATL
jgi:DNA invertase Pin-like site-specific DNA recombinase